MSKKILVDQDLGSVAKIINVPAPTLAGDAVNKSYVDTLVEGLAWKDNVRVASTATVNIASPGTTMDGVTLASLDRILLKDQSSPAENGLYIFNSGVTPLTRAVDASTGSELLNAIVSVDEGSTNAGTTWRQTAIAITIGTTPVAWASFATAVPLATTVTAGKIRIATQGEVDTGAVTDASVTPATLAGYANKKLKKVQAIGDGSATQYDVTHNFGTYDLVVSVFRNSAPYDDVITDVERSDTNTVRIRFASAPAANAFKVVIIG